ncbi:MAG: hypothetical protein MI802_23135, partial [Desulfobacterales bacterium]|nr:hypothetical protein [Desulfobacterales bacterium]
MRNKTEMRIFFRATGLAFVFFAALMAVVSGPAGAQDMRQAFQDLEKQKEEMAVKAERELSAAKAEAKEKALAIKSNRLALHKAIAEFKAANQRLKKEITGFEKQIDTLIVDGERLRESLSESRAVNKELAGFVRTYAKDLHALLVQSLQSALVEAEDTAAPAERRAFLDPVISQERFWSMDDVARMSELLFGEIQRSGEVKVTTGPIVDRQGKDRTAKILTIGNFTGIYVLEAADGAPKETGFLLYSDESQRLFALSR